jgi:hypothetical protein
MRFLVDECVGTTVSGYLKSEKHVVFCVFDEFRGVSDEQLLQKCFDENYILFGQRFWRNDL